MSNVYWVTLDPTFGTKINKTRPAVIVSNSSCNRKLLKRCFMPN
ncbi:MAG: type II toxin-antitoxin system PemK/MazF family toxin [Rhabdochlamydiaceae bacterium]